MAVQRGAALTCPRSQTTTSHPFPRGRSPHSREFVECSLSEWKKPLGRKTLVNSHGIRYSPHHAVLLSWFPRETGTTNQEAFLSGWKSLLVSEVRLWRGNEAPVKSPVDQTSARLMEAGGWGCEGPGSPVAHVGGAACGKEATVRPGLLIFS